MPEPVTHNLLTKGGSFFLAAIMEYWKELDEAQRLLVLTWLEEHAKTGPPHHMDRLDQGR